MTPVAYNVTDLSADQRHAIEGVLGQPLRDNQQVVIQVAEHPQSKVRRDDEAAPGSKESSDRTLPVWASIFADLSTDEIDELESVILDRSESRDVEPI
jgi:hypothetical protein